MKRLLALLLAPALLLPAEQPLFSHIGTIEQGLAAITGLAFTRHVPYALITKDQLRHYLDQRLHETIKPAELRAEELTLKMLGLVPPDFDLRQNTLDLLTEQAAAFYDYNQKKLFVLEGSGQGLEERVALIHELAHALADQHFHLARFIHQGLQSDDASSARQAIMEGQATWLMAAYLSRESGGPAEIPKPVLELLTRSIEGSAAQQYPVFSKAPLYIRESLVFPYADGMLFQDAAYRKLGRQAFAEVFLHPPVSTRQIFHPDQYLAHDAPQIPRLPAVPEAGAFRKLAEGTLGELDFRVLLSQYLGRDPGTGLASHLAGGSYELLEHKQLKFPVLGVASAWDSQALAQQYFAQYRRVLEGKWKKLEISSETPARLEGRGDSGYFRVWIDGATVNQLEGWNSPLD